VQSQTQEELRDQLPPFGAALTTSIILSSIGWVGLLLLVVFTVPTLGPRWLLFFLVTLAFSGMALPVVHYLHRRFPGKPVATSVVMIREALLVGAYADILLWLQFGKVLNFALAILIAAGLIAMEVFMRIREKNRWTPPPPTENE
jgi:hypothetical protein